MAAFILGTTRSAALRGVSEAFSLSTPLDIARASCTPKGRCRIGWIVANSGRDSWDVWLDVQTGEGRLRRRRK